MKIEGGTEGILMQAIQRVQAACISNQMMHLSHCFVDDPDYLAVVACFSVCPDNLAKDLHAKLDATAAEFYAKHGLHIR
jgi:hypothetical protein